MTCYTGRQCRLLSMLCLTGILFMVELVVGYITNSMALVADSFHMLSDVLALVVAFVSVKMSSRSWSKNTYGWVRAEVLGALINGVFLITLSFTIFIEALQRLHKLEEVKNPKLLLIVGCIGFAFNLIGLLLFHEHGHSHGSTRKKCNENTSRQNHDHHNQLQHNYNTGQINQSYTSDIIEHKHCINKHDDTQQIHNSKIVSRKNEPNDYDHTNFQKERYQKIHDINSEDNKVIVECISHQISSDSKQQGINSDDNRIIDTYLSHQIRNENENQNSPRKQSDHTINNINKKNTKVESQMNIRGVYLHILSDTGGSIIVIISALVVWLTDWEYSVYIDPVLSMCMVLLISISTIPLLKDTSFILLQGIPTNIEIDNITKQILNIEGVLDIHEFHVWQLSGKTYVASAHIKCSNQRRHLNVADKIKVIFHNEGIHSTTIQQEFVDIEDRDRPSRQSKEDCILKCPADDQQGCLLKSCCNASDTDSLNTNAHQ